MDDKTLCESICNSINRYLEYTGYRFNYQLENKNLPSLDLILKNNVEKIGSYYLILQLTEELENENQLIVNFLINHDLGKLIIFKNLIFDLMKTIKYKYKTENNEYNNLVILFK